MSNLVPAIQGKEIHKIECSWIVKKVMEKRYIK